MPESRCGSREINETNVSYHTFCIHYMSYADPETTRQHDARDPYLQPAPRLGSDAQCEQIRTCATLGSWSLARALLLAAQLFTCTCSTLTPPRSAIAGETKTWYSRIGFSAPLSAEFALEIKLLFPGLGNRMF